jgi:hypothetical protein
MSTTRVTVSNENRKIHASAWERACRSATGWCFPSMSSQNPPLPVSRPSTSGKTVGFQQLMGIALSGDRNSLVDAVERVGVSAMMERDELGNTLLHLVAATGDLKMIKLLLRLGVVVDSLNDCAQTAAMVAEDFGNSAISEYLNRKIEEKRQTRRAQAQTLAGAPHDAPENEACEESNFENDYLDAVLNYAIMIGIDAQNEPHLLALAEEGLGAPLPDEWQERDGMYVNIKTSEMRTEHPNDEIFKRRVVEARARALLHAGEERVEVLLQQQPANESCSTSEKDAKGQDEHDNDVASYDEDFEQTQEETEEVSKCQLPVLDDDAMRTMILLQERLKLKTRDMERFGRQTHRAASPDFLPHALPLSGSAYGFTQNSSPAKDRTSSTDDACASASPSPPPPRVNADLAGRSHASSKSEFDRLMKRYMGFSATQAGLLIDDRRERQRAIKEAMKGFQAKYNSITTSLRHFLDSKASDKSRIAATKPVEEAAVTRHAPAVTLPAVPASHKLRAPQLVASPFQESARPPNNPWILPRKFTMLFDPEHMRPSKSDSLYTKLKPAYMQGRSLQSPSVSVALHPSINPHRMSDDNDSYAFMLDPRRRHKLIAKQMARSDRPQCASPWSPELKKSGVWDKNGYLDCNAFLFGDKYIHYNRQNIRQMDLDDELRRKGVRKAEELLWPNPDPYRHLKRGAGAKSP